MARCCRSAFSPVARSAEDAGSSIVRASCGDGMSTDGMGLIIAFDPEGKVIGRSISKIHTGPQPFSPLQGDLVNYKEL